MMNRFSPLIVLLLAACGTGGPVIHAPGATPQMSVPGMQGTLNAFRDVPTTTTTIAATPDSAWSALVHVYSDLGLPVSTIDVPHRALATTDERLRTVGGERVNRYVECVDSYGSSSSYEIYLTVLTMLEPAASGSTLVKTQLVATGRPLTGGSRRSCITNGTLEAAIANALRARLGLQTAAR